MTRWVRVGRLGAPVGLKGHLRLDSYTDPPDRIWSYRPWFIEADPPRAIAGEVDREQRGTRWLAKLPGVDDRDAAARFTQSYLVVPRDRLPAAAPGEYYWADLEGLQVFDLQGVALGQVVQVFNNGANDVLVLRAERERMVPFAPQRIETHVDLDAGTIRIDWDADF